MNAFSNIPNLAGLFHTIAGSIINAFQYIQKQLLKLLAFTEIILTTRIQLDFGLIFTLEKFKQFCLLQKMLLTLAAPKHLKKNSLL